MADDTSKPNHRPTDEDSVLSMQDLEDAVLDKSLPLAERILAEVEYRRRVGERLDAGPGGSEESRPAPEHPAIVDAGREERNGIPGVPREPRQGQAMDDEREIERKREDAEWFRRQAEKEREDAESYRREIERVRESAQRHDREMATAVGCAVFLVQLIPLVALCMSSASWSDTWGMVKKWLFASSAFLWGVCVFAAFCVFVGWIRGE